jgi:hypothetical protein
VNLAHTNPDPLASLRMAPLIVALGGADYTIPAYPAARWLEVLLADKINLEAVFPGLAGLDAELAVNQALASQRITQDELEEVIYEVLEAASGRRWWVALRLCGTLRSHWEWAGGAMARNGLTPFDVPLAFWLDGAYATMIHEMVSSAHEQEDLNRIANWVQALTVPPASLARAEASDTMDRDAFLALARRHGR